MHKRTQALLLTLSLVTLSACGGAVPAADPGTGSGTGGGTEGKPGKPTPNTVSGRVLDVRGDPVPGVKLIIEPAMFRGTVFTSTGTDGKYQSIELNPATNPYYVSAYKEVNYHDRQYCLRMAGDPEPYKDAFNASAGVIRNFRWKISGPSDQTNDNIGSGFWGGSLALLNTFTDPDEAVDRSAQVEVTLVPDGPLIDGSTGTTIKRVTSVDKALQDIPVGYYTLTAALVNADGSQTPLSVSRTNTEESLRPSAKVLFNGYDSCGHSGTLVKTYFWIARP
ncbi:carboxypeptidase-like regulatory domain-containing protein [Deinococcus humi]|uniref:Carboxypeptidase regulatory-like domain-containing protein n=1 Tax=Deinococcus humi TaxID=662880 RepID=A0A7W8JUP4_9DEIO|nr:carboxypeptidase-like regulatory domain-containing protein [Deinococcus humi]MBB5363516.1 hypothetical protein [Deinococcus humi]GGO30411.1 hypothetical protein GCM10008949_25260 [Deinococcus humi]